MSENIRIVYVDCTETSTSCLSTGIQRNVNNIIRRSDLVFKEYGVNIIPVISVSGKFYEYDASNSKKKCVTYLGRIFVYLRNTLDRMYYKKNEVSQNSVDHNYPAISNSYHLKIVELCRSVMPFIYLMAYRLDGSVREFSSISINGNDIIFFSDLFWNANTYKSLLLYNNVCKIVLVYDVIPITTPELCDDINVIMFNKHIRQIVHHIDGIVTISNSERKAIQIYLNTLSKCNDIPIEYYYLGADFVPVQLNGSRVRDIVRNAMSSKNVFLMVGTIEPRKNHAFVLDAFEELWRRGENASLCIIGKIGWKCSDLLERINTHSLLGKSLFCFHDAIDEELAFCYKQCRAVVFASIAEGFGLPLVEAMSYGRNVLASDIPVFREIGEDYPIYFPLDDLDAFVQCLYNFNNDVFTKRQPKTWISWDESVLSLFGKILRMADKSKQSREAS